MAERVAYVGDDGTGGHEDRCCGQHGSGQHHDVTGLEIGQIVECLDHPGPAMGHARTAGRPEHQIPGLHGKVVDGTAHHGLAVIVDIGPLVVAEPQHRRRIGRGNRFVLPCPIEGQ